MTNEEKHESKKHKVKHLVNQGKITNVLLGVILIVLLLNSFQLSDLSRTVSEIEITAPEDVDQVVPAANPPSAPPAAPKVNIELNADDYVKGDADAPVTIVEYSDFECPFCARFYTQTYSLILSEYVEKGDVKVVFRHFPLGFHANAQKAAEAADCAGDQDKFWEMHDKLFEDGVVGGVATFKGYAAGMGLDQTEFDSCLDSGKHAASVKAEMDEGSRLGITGTPGFFINGQKVVGAQPFAVFQAAIEAEL